MAHHAIGVGNDADTTGAFYGEDDIPAAWRDTIAQRKFIGELAEKLLAQGAA